MMATNSPPGSGQPPSFGRILHGTSGNDFLYGYSTNDTLYGYGGHDYLDGGPGADTMYGGTGNDTYIVDNGGDVVVENANEGYDTVRSSVTYTLASNVERLELTGSAAINGTGNNLANYLLGNAASNTLSGGGGLDYLSGGAGADILIGGTENDTYVVENAGDVVIEYASEGYDTVESSISYTLGANVERLSLLQSGGAINGTGNSLDNHIYGNGYNNHLSGGAGIDYLSGGAGSDWLKGDDGGDTLVGGADGDVLDGGTGADTMIGGTGNDKYVVDNAADVVIEYADQGYDMVYSSISYTLGANVDELKLQDDGGTINGTGNALDNEIEGNAFDNVLAGGDGNDIVLGKNGNDTLIGGAGWDTLIGGEGDDILDGGAGGHETLEGGLGNDVLIGGNGVESLWGNEGDDIFKFAPGDTGLGDGADIIRDFTSSATEHDKIDLSAYGFTDFGDLNIHVEVSNFGNSFTTVIDLTPTEQIWMFGSYSLTADDFIL
jgi:Ca2+-binding RTX toxin-like protein